MNATSDMKLEILSPEKILFKGQATSVTAPGKLGYMMILPGHAAIIAELDVGLLEFSSADQGVHKYFVAGGFVEVKDHNVRVLADVIEKPADIDTERAKKSVARAQERLSVATQDEMDYVRALAALKRANMRITVAGAERAQ